MLSKYSTSCGKDTATICCRCLHAAVPLVTMGALVAWLLGAVAGSVAGSAAG
jgi:hypothetical protein